MPSHVPLYPMRTVAKLTSVEPHRIRFWETRYGLVRPARDESGRRLFTKKEVDRIRKIGQLVDGYGMSLVAIRRLLREESA
ncbi:MAG TPA: MerR family transcriptional regulator [Armatimonadota bacterium]|nr:MerR family transcriptional regulator [Armatimonadota bacterium]